MVTVRLFSIHATLIHQESLPIIIVPEVIEWAGRKFTRDYSQPCEWQRYTEASSYNLDDEKK